MTDVTMCVIQASAIALVTFCAVGVVRRISSSLGWLDVPNSRSSHRAPTPRGGGLAFVVVSISAIAIIRCGTPGTPGWLALLLGALTVAAVGLRDDARALPAWIRLAVHLAAAIVLATACRPALDRAAEAFLLPEGSRWIAVPLCILWTTGVTNAYNFMDGVDGLAASQAVVTSGAVAYMAHVKGNDELATMACALMAAVIGFLLHNWPPAKIFMGDVGSGFLGFAFGGASVLSLAGSAFPVPFWAWCLMLSPILLDSGVTLLRRGSRGVSVWQAHRDHLYQRLVRGGWSHRMVTVTYLVASIEIHVGVAAFVAHQARVLLVGGLLLSIVTVSFMLLLGPRAVAIEQ